MINPQLGSLCHQPCLSALPGFYFQAIGAQEGWTPVNSLPFIGSLCRALWSRVSGAAGMWVALVFIGGLTSVQLRSPWQLSSHLPVGGGF